MLPLEYLYAEKLQWVRYGGSIHVPFTVAIANTTMRGSRMTCCSQAFPGQNKRLDRAVENHNPVSLPPPTTHAPKDKKLPI